MRQFNDVPIVDAINDDKANKLLLESLNKETYEEDEDMWAQKPDSSSSHLLRTKHSKQ